MNEAAYAFVSTSKERKQLGQSARKRVTGKSKYVTMPSDNLTPKERKELNGKLSTYEMDKPHTYLELLAFPKDIRKEYLQGIMDKYHPSINDLAYSMLHCGRNTALELLKGLGVNWERSYRNATQKFEWRVFLGENITPPEPEPVREDVKTPDMSFATVLQPPSMGRIEHLSLHVAGKPMQVSHSLPLILDPNKTYYFSINITEMEDKKLESDPCAAAEGA